ncbi:hypothetical protein GCM10010502_62970 [Kitasatospora aureofaciens]|uniref:Uncharacterized protein n=1 Tax=Kitasatospora aureofaciens TaxID=1894 RepID=A0A8H9I2M6_KITAU|nr:hypothetical protein GCM10010502_62970 [Kitasatospora aureofaciens]
MLTLSNRPGYVRFSTTAVLGFTLRGDGMSQRGPTRVSLTVHLSCRTAEPSFVIVIAHSANTQANSSTAVPCNKSQIRGAPARRSRGSARDAAAWGRAGPEQEVPWSESLSASAPASRRLPAPRGPGPADAPRCAGDDWEVWPGIAAGPHSRRRVWPRGGGGHGVCLCSYSELRLSNSQQKF